MSKYIIKNCPTLMGNRLCYGKTIKQCADCTDCVMKQIVDKCRDKMDTEFNSGSMFAEEILQLFDIEEV